ncbi:MAG TPA: alpha-E domain-containing protein [Burkholderiaceae bacterium]|jgi:uncharacterized alpha-E superfamily protein|nr:alpha-E domain-containing protein [Burkholderiaceae bacterium]
MLSRTADHLFWMARYIERSDNRRQAIASQANVSAANVKLAQRAAGDKTRVFEEHGSADA